MTLCVCCIVSSYLLPPFHKFCSMDRALLLFWSLAIVCSSFTLAVCSTDVPREFLDALREIESVGAGGVCAVGDSGRSLGAYQIMMSYYTEAVQQNSSLSNGGNVKLSLK